MTQIILIEPEDNLRSILKHNIMKTICCSVIEKKSAYDAISLMELIPNIDLVICRDIVESENAGATLAQFFVSGGQSIPLLVLGSFKSEYKHSFNVELEQTWENIVISCGKILKKDISLDEIKMVEDYVPVSIDYFRNITNSSMGCDIYVKVKKEGVFQYIKLLHSTDNFSPEDIERYSASGLLEFYILKEKFPEFVNYVTLKMTIKLENKRLNVPDRIILTTQSYDLSLECIKILGIDSHTIGLVEEEFKSMLTTLKDDKALATFLQILKKNKLSYAYSHSYLCSIIFHKIIDFFEWKTPNIKEKLSYIAFFHDISLQENQMLYNSEEQVNNSKLEKNEKQFILNHANQSASIVSKFASVPSGVDTILKEHHGSKTGFGFPETLSIAISPLSMMFVVVENFVDEFLKLGPEPKSEDLEKIFKKLIPKYTKVTYLQTIMALQDMTQGKKSKSA